MQGRYNPGEVVVYNNARHRARQGLFIVMKQNRNTVSIAKLGGNESGEYNRCTPSAIHRVQVENVRQVS